MIGAARRYKELMNKLLLQRELAGGQLSVQEEARFVGALDRCWQAMSDREQNEVERIFAVPCIT